MLPPSENTAPDPGMGLIAGRRLFWSGVAFCTIAAPWMLGSEIVSAQWALLVGAFMAFVGGSVVHLNSHPTPGARAAFRAQRWVAGLLLAFIGYLFIQAINPSLQFLPGGKPWTLTPINQAFPGPHSIRAPFAPADGEFLPHENAWRYLLIYGSAWLLAASLALGLKSRDEAFRWVRILAANGVAVALVCIVHRVLGSKLTLWHFHGTPFFTGAPVFFYKNHNGCYLAAAVAAALGLAHCATERRSQRIWEISALLIWVATVSVNSRTATGIATLWCLIYAGLRLRLYVSREKQFSRLFLPAVISVLMIAAAFALPNSRTSMQRFSTALSAPVDFVQGGEYRSLLRQVGFKMWEDEPVWGWGGGSFMYLFFNYESQVPAFRAEVHRTQPNLSRYYVFSVDSDWVEFLLEFGLAGVSLLGGAGLAASAFWLRWRGWSAPLPLFLFLGFAGIILHAYLDHVLRNPALFMMLVCLPIVALRLAVPGAKTR